MKYYTKSNIINIRHKGKYTISKENILISRLLNEAVWIEDTEIVEEEYA